MFVKTARSSANVSVAAVTGDSQNLRTARMKAYRNYFPLQPSRKFNRSEDGGRLRLGVSISGIVRSGVGVFDCGKINTISEVMSNAGEKHHTRSVALSSRGEEFRNKQVGEQERPDMVRRNLVFQSVYGQFECRNDGGSSVID